MAKKTKPSKELSKSEELFNFLYGACDIIRGPLNQDEYKNYLIPIIFFKRISDVYDEETEQLLKDTNGDKDYAALPEMHSFNIPEKCHWNDVRNKSENVGQEISKALNGIEKANMEMLGGVFNSFDEANWTDKTKLSDDILKNLIEHFSSVKLGNKNYAADVMGDSYEYLIKKFADLSKKNAGEFYTPRFIVKLMVMLLNPKDGESVYDPAAGTGGMLIESIKHMNNSRLSYGKIYGQESNLSTSAMAKMNLFLHGAKDFHIVQGDTLRTPKFIQNDQLQTFDCVLANPPFSLDKWGADIFISDKYGRNIWGCPSDSNADFAWLQHMIKSMDKNNGRCAVILAQGVLFRGNSDSQIRKGVIESDKIECVITLPSGVFFSTGVSACIILLNNNKQESHKNKILFIDGSKQVVTLRAKKIMSEDNLNKIFKAYLDYQDEVEFSKLVTIDEVKVKEFNLSPTTYLDFKQEETLDVKQVREDYKKAVEAVKEAEKKMRECLIKGGFINE